jgi:anti-sigma regulatory factor (Ser/Thr protein kinase)
MPAPQRRYDPAVADEQSFRLSNDLTEVPALRERFARACVAGGVPEEIREGQMLVITELVNNAIEHGCCLPSHTVECSYLITAEDIRIEVTDPSGELTEDDFRNSDASGFADNGRGAGLFLIQALTDEIAVRREPRGGTTVITVKHLRAGAGT